MDDGCESGFIPGTLWYLTKWYTKRELGKRTVLFFIGSYTANLLNGLIACGLSRLRGRAGLTGSFLSSFSEPPPHQKSLDFLRVPRLHRRIPLLAPPQCRLAQRQSTDSPSSRNSSRALHSNDEISAVPASHIFQASDSPYYHKGFKVLFIMAALAIGFMVGMRLVYGWLHRRIEGGKETIERGEVDRGFRYQL